MYHQVMWKTMQRIVLGSTARATFKFEPRWKEELVVSGLGGEFVLEHPMGVKSVYVPTEVVWNEIGPNWALGHWAALHHELKIWCEKNGAELYVDETASVSFDGPV